MQTLKQAAAADQPELIGQFGVGFYASFMVAEQVALITRRAGDQQKATRWESIGDGSYTIEECTKETRGTDIVLTLKEDFVEYLDEWRIRSIVKKYSDFIQYPVQMTVTRTVPVTDDEGNEIEGGGTIEKEEVQTLNSMKAIWARPKSDVSEEEYQEFYKHVAHDFENPFRTIHFSAEGTSEFKALLYLPAKKPFDIFMAERKRGIQLYVRRVFITEKCDELLPDYLRFVRGVVDSADLPLNVSRELLQEDQQIRRIQKSLVGKVLTTLIDLKEKEYDDYVSFWQEFGPIIKEGVHLDFANREKLQDLLLFESSNSEPRNYISLKQYVERMPENQKEIYVITGEDRQTVEQSPLLEAFKKKGFDVLFLTDPVDEWVLQSLNQYDEKPLKAVDRGDVDIDTEDEKKERESKQEAAKQSYGSVLEFINSALDGKVKEVRFSKRLTDSACCLVADEYGMNANMERIMRAMNQDVPENKRVLELNADHPIVKVMSDMHGTNPDNPRLKDYAGLLYDQALLTEGSPIKDPLSFTRLISELMVAAASR